MAVTEVDIGPLTWVKSEIEQALGRAADALGQYAADSARTDALRFAQTHLHQAHGALAVVGLDGVTQVSEAVERLLAELEQGQVAHPQAVPELASSALVAVRQYLDGLLDGRPNQPLRLLPLYRRLQEARGHKHIDGADLFFPDPGLRPPRRESEPPPLTTGQAQLALKAARARFERGFLQWLRAADGKAGLADMRTAVDDIEALQTLPNARAFWWATSGLLEALEAGQVPVDLALKKLCARIDTQMRRFLEGARTVAERLMRDVLYRIASAPGGTPRVDAVKAAYRLAELIPAEDAARVAEIERARPALRALKLSAEEAKDAWNRFCGGAAVALPQFDEQAGRLVERAQSVGMPVLLDLARALRETGNWLRKSPLDLNEQISLETATALLLLEQAVDQFEQPDPELPAHAHLICQRLAALRQRQPLAPLEAPLLGEMSRRAEEKLYLTQLAHEIGASLAEIEQALDAYFRDPTQVEPLVPLGRPFKQIEGALAVAGRDDAVTLLRECAASVERFQQTDYSPQPGEFEAVAHKLSALGFFVERLPHGGADLQELLAPTRREREEPTTVEEELEQQKRQTGAMMARLKEAPSDAGLRRELRQSLESMKQEAALVADAGLEKQVKQALEDLAKPVVEPPAAPAPAPAATPPSAEQIDAELLEIFLEEAREVVATIGEHHAQALQAPRDKEALTVIRRGFHTLKGSGRMVGLRDLGEAAWSAEQVMNRWLQLELGATPELLAFIGEARDLFDRWVQQLAGGGGSAMEAAALYASAERLKGAGAESSAAASESVAVAGPASPAAAELPAAPELASPATAELAAAAEPAVPQAPLLPQPAPDEAVQVYALEDEELDAATEMPWAPAAEQPVEAPVAPEPTAFAPLDLEEDSIGAPLAAAAAEPLVEASAGPAPVLEPAPAAPDESVQIGALAMSSALYDMYLGEASAHVATLRRELARLHLDPTVPPGESAARAAHTLAGISATVGLDAVHDLARAFEHALGRLAALRRAPDDGETGHLDAAVGVLEAMVGALSTRQAPAAAPETIKALDSVAPEDAGELPAPSAAPIAPASTSKAADEGEDRRRLRLADDLDPQLLPIFLEEAQDLMREIGVETRAWREAPQRLEAGRALKRLLHTLKGSARMAGAMGLGELVHATETRIEETVAANAVGPVFFDELDATVDRAATWVDRLRCGDFAPPPTAPAGAAPATGAPELAQAQTTEPVAAAQTAAAAAEAEVASAQLQLRVRADLIDRFVNEAGEMAIARARIEGEMRALRHSLLDLTENVIRLRSQLRELEISAESQMQSHQQQAEAHRSEFDPLEFDRFTRLQELTRMIAESVNDVTTVQHNVLKNLDGADAALVAQGRLNRELQQALMRVRMMPFASLADRLHRIVRQSAKELGKKANLDIRGERIEMDRSVLDKIVGPLEHLLRNAVTHGLEGPDERAAHGKGEMGQVTLAVSQEGNEVALELADDGRGLDFGRIRARAVELGVLGADEDLDEARLTEMIFRSGFSTADTVSELAGRGVGMDVVKSAATSLGGRIEVSSVPGQGTRFRIYLPQSLAVTQALLVKVGAKTYAIPSTMVEQVMELRADPLEKLEREGVAEWLGNRYPYRYLPRLLGDSHTQPQPARYTWVVLARSGAQRVSVRIDALRGNEEIVVKPLGAQLSRVVGLAGATVLGDGEVVLIVNPVALAARGERSDVSFRHEPAVRPEVHAAARPTVMVVDDSLTVRKITGKLLEREGYRVLTAKDGVDALEQLLEEVPAVMLVDIEMPRMDGFDLTRNVRSDERLKAVPIIMITSRIADKHRNYAQEIGVDHYLGKPYQEDELLELIGRYTGAARLAASA